MNQASDLTEELFCQWGAEFWRVRSSNIFYPLIYLRCGGYGLLWMPHRAYVYPYTPHTRGISVDKSGPRRYSTYHTCMEIGHTLEFLPLHGWTPKKSPKKRELNGLWASTFPVTENLIAVNLFHGVQFRSIAPAYFYHSLIKLDIFQNKLGTF